MKRLVLDLRQNPGGLIPQAVAMADLFLDPGDSIALTRGRTAEHSRVYVDRLPQAWPRMPVALLVNRNTASAAELLAGALQDHDRARIVGTATYGKGVIQTTFPLGEEVAVKFTTSRWYTPSGRSIQRSDSVQQDGRRFRSSRGRALPAGEGIVPDVVAAPVRPAAALVVDRGFGTDLPIFEAVLDAYVKELKARGGAQMRAAVVTPAMMEELWARLEAAGSQTPRRIYDRIAPYVRETFSDAMVQAVWGEEPALRRRLSADAQVHAALNALAGIRVRR
jgi:carboxyl-terminal processing protease